MEKRFGLIIIILLGTCDFWIGMEVRFHSFLFLPQITFIFNTPRDNQKIEVCL